MKIVNTCQRVLGRFAVGVYGLMGLGVPDGIDLSDAPGGDLSLDDLFGETPRTPTTVDNTIQPQSQPGTTTSPAEPVIKTKTGTVYKTIEAAVEGIEHKDALISQLREQVRQTSGHDPLAARQAPTAPPNYTENKDAYFKDIAKAVAENNSEAYMQAQQKLMWDTLGPLTPTITALSRANAERVVAEQLPEFKGYLASDQYATIEQDSPLLAQAIRSAESNPAAASQLPELYRIAYLASQGRRVPELIQSVQGNAHVTPPRPTVQSTQLAPPPTTGVPVATPTLQNSAGRKAIIERMEAGGVMDLKW